MATIDNRLDELRDRRQREDWKRRQRSRVRRTGPGGGVLGTTRSQEQRRRSGRSRIVGAGGRIPPGILARFGGIITGVAATVADIAGEVSQQRLDEAWEGLKNQIKIRAQRRARELDLREVRVRGDVGGLPTDQPTVGPPSVPEVPLPSGRVPEPESVFTGDVAVEFEPIEPDIAFPEPTFPGTATPDPAAEPGPGLSGEVAPGTDVAGEIAQEIATEIATSGAPQQIFGQPLPAPLPAPVLAPLPPPVNPLQPGSVVDPVIWGLPGLTPPKSKPLQFAGVSDDPVSRVIEFPVPQPELAPQQQRCKPCKEDNPKPRDRCFKGLYREGILDTEVDFTEWAEIDCITGREL